MKFKPIYLYGILAAAIVVILFIVAPSGKEEKTNVDITNKQMPNDNVHKNMNKGMMDNPSGSNVSEEVKHKIEVMKKDVEANPNDTLKMREYADFLAAAHKSDEALIYYQKILDKDNNRKDVYFGMTFVYYNQGNLAKAEEVTRQMLKLFPDDAMVNYNVGAIEATKGNKEKAREIWTKLIKDFPNDKTSELAKSSIKKL
ncbi:MAG: tetratricopeptide repeat protein [Ignavibacteriaceae bacterium]|nr:tetratricopeptide repeat protein [Ignavibacterium sp.]MCC6254726.1 tetratricopeptide repeat protein [Ignavibacteriaceae bacterium]